MNKLKYVASSSLFLISRRPVLILLVISLLIATSLLVGVSLQHMQLLDKVSAIEAREDRRNPAASGAASDAPASTTSRYEEMLRRFPIPIARGSS